MAHAAAELGRSDLADGPTRRGRFRYLVQNGDEGDAAERVAENPLVAGTSSFRALDGNEPADLGRTAEVAAGTATTGEKAFSILSSSSYSKPRQRRERLRVAGIDSSQRAVACQNGKLKLGHACNFYGRKECTYGRLWNYSVRHSGTGANHSSVGNPYL